MRKIKIDGEWKLFFLHRIQSNLTLAEGEEWWDELQWTKQHETKVGPL